VETEPIKNSLTWDDLLIQNISQADAKEWLGYWSGWISGAVAPIFMSKFGDWFLRSQDGSTVELSVIEGTVQKIASTPGEFAASVNSKEWQETHLLSKHILDLHSRGIVPAARQCYGLAPHPTFLGKIDIDRATLMDIGVWQHICAQTFPKRGVSEEFKRTAADVFEKNAELFKKLAN
jgi:hypothetical protein